LRQEVCDFNYPTQKYVRRDWVAFYADCEHEVSTVTSGCRVVLVYNLILKKGMRPHLVGHPGYPKESEMIPAEEDGAHNDEEGQRCAGDHGRDARSLKEGPVMRRYNDSGCRPDGDLVARSLVASMMLDVALDAFVKAVAAGAAAGTGRPEFYRLGFVLGHAYTESGLGWERLKGSDRVVAARLRLACRKHDLELFLCTLEARRITVPDRLPDDHGPIALSTYDGVWVTDYVGAEPSPRDRELRKRNAAGMGNPLPTCSTSPGPLEEMRDANGIWSMSQEELAGRKTMAMMRWWESSSAGNYPAIQHFSYRSTALVMWPRSAGVRARCDVRGECALRMIAKLPLDSVPVLEEIRHPDAFCWQRPSPAGADSPLSQDFDSQVLSTYLEESSEEFRLAHPFRRLKRRER
jgi:hypothetical protein